MMCSSSLRHIFDDDGEFYVDIRKIAEKCR